MWLRVCVCVCVCGSVFVYACVPAHVFICVGRICVAGKWQGEGQDVTVWQTGLGFGFKPAAVPYSPTTQDLPCNS